MVKECDMHNYLTQLFLMYTCDFLIKIYFCVKGRGCMLCAVLKNERSL